MKKTIVALTMGVAFFYVNANAQVSAQLAGKKLQVVSTQNSTVTVTQMGNEMSMPMTTASYASYEIKSVTGKNVQMSGTLTRTKGSVTVMGNETKYDTDDSSSVSSNPQTAELLKDVKQEKNFTVEIGKTPDMTNMQNGLGVDVIASALFYPFEKSAAEGAKYSDSSKSENGSNVFTEYVLSKIANDEATVTATTTATISSTTQRNGMDVKSNLQLKSTSTRVYGLSTGLLKTDTTDTNMSGTNEVASMSIPITMKGTTTTTVQ